MKVAAGDEGKTRTGQARGGEESHAMPLNYHPHKRMELMRADVEPAGVERLLDSGAGVTDIFEDVHLQLQQQWFGEEFKRPYIGGMKP